MPQYSNNKKIARNTLLLYSRMFITMIVQLYTSRIVLDVLGVANYGIWNLVGSIVVSVSFVTAPLTSVTQRFLSIEIASQNDKKVANIFSQSMIVYIVFATIILILAETIGLWFINYKIQLPPESFYYTNIVYQFVILSFIASLFKLPYDATIIAYERMDFYAYMSIADVTFKLLVVYLLEITTLPRLPFYASLMAGVNIIILLVYIVYCRYKYSITRLRLKIDRLILKELVSFSSWSILGSFSLMTANQGVNIVVNQFCGVLLNATMGVSSQVGNAVNQFAVNFQTAFQPQIVKLYAGSNIRQLGLLINRTFRITFMLLAAIALPLIFNIDQVLHVWLGDNIPLYTAKFCVYTLIAIFIDSISAPFWMTIQAVGKIVKYQIVISFIICLNLILSYVFLSLGYDVSVVMKIKCFVSLSCLLTRILFVKKYIDFNLNNFVVSIIRMCTVLLFSVSCLFMASQLLKNVNLSITFLIAEILVFEIAYLFICFSVGLDKTERNSIKAIVYNKLKA